MTSTQWGGKYVFGSCVKRPICFGQWTLIPQDYCQWRVVLIFSMKISQVLFMSIVVHFTTYKEWTWERMAVRVQYHELTEIILTRLIVVVYFLLVGSCLERVFAGKFIASGTWVVITKSIACAVGKDCVLACLLICALLHLFPEHDRMWWPGNTLLLVKTCLSKKDSKDLANNSFGLHCGPLTMAILSLPII